jgi:hypothetical protein
VIAERGADAFVGLFLAVLDFGSEAFDGSPRWLEIGVRTNGSGNDYTLLSPRQAIKAEPYATFANAAANAAVAKTANIKETQNGSPSHTKNVNPKKAPTIKISPWAKWVKSIVLTIKLKPMAISAYILPEAKLLIIACKNISISCVLPPR